jgi:hypothetical protein
MDNIDIGLPPKNDGKFKKGISGNYNGRPKSKKVNQDKLNELFDSADGDPILFQKLVLQNGKHLALDLNTALKLAKELAPYEKPRLASVEQKVDKTTNFLIVDPTKIEKGSEEYKLINETIDEDI